MTKHKTNDADQSDLDHCLRPLLKQLGWQGNDALLHESMPHMMNIDTEQKFTWVMRNLGYSTKSLSIRLNNLDEKLFPCVFMPDDDSSPLVILQKADQGLRIFNTATKKEERISDLNIQGTALSFKKKSDAVIQENYTHWVRDVLYNCKGVFFLLLLVAFFQAILMLVPPVYIMVVYDQVVGSNSYMMLAMFTVGALFALFSLFMLMSYRSRIMGYLGARLQHNIGNLIFMRLLKLPPTNIETAPLTSQISRLSNFNQFREFFSGPVFSAMIDVPFVLLFLIFIWLIGGILVLVPLVAIFIYLLASVIIWFFSRRTISNNSAVRGKYQNYLLETFSGMRSLQYSGLQDTWLSRFKELSAASCLHGQGALLVNTVSESVFDALNILTGLATLCVGAILIIHNALQAGAFIAVLFVIWRLLSPIKILSMSFQKLVHFKRSIKQINSLMHFPTELPSEHQWENTPRKITGDIQFQQVSFRYPGSDEFVLKNINFSVKAGTTLVILGPTGSGKSTIVNLLLNLYPVQGGQIFIDNRNIKQFDVGLLRKNMATVLQKTELFYGTIAENLKLARPLASKQDLMDAAKSSNLLEIINQLPDGFDTHIRFYGDERLGPSFCQKMNLARAYLREASILILDEPESSLDPNNMAIFSDYIASIKGKKTIVILTDSTKHLAVADHAIVLYDGYIASAGKPDDVLKNIPKEIIS